MRICDVTDCEKPIKNRGLCAGHYERFRLGKPIDATPLGPSIKGTPIEERFWPRVNKTATCWLWMGPLFDGYGRIKRGTKALPVHRFAYELLVGPIPDGLMVDVPGADHPSLVLGVPRDAASAGAPGSFEAAVLLVELVGHGLQVIRSHASAVVALVVDGKRVSGGTYVDLEEAKAAAIALRNRLKTNNLQDRREVA